MESPLRVDSPFGIIDLESGVRDEAVPDEGLEGFGLGSDVLRGNLRDDNNHVAYFVGVARLATNNPKYFCLSFLSKLKSPHDINADVFLSVSAAHT